MSDSVTARNFGDTKTRSGQKTASQSHRVYFQGVIRVVVGLGHDVVEMVRSGVVGFVGSVVLLK